MWRQNFGIEVQHNRAVEALLHQRDICRHIGIFSNEPAVLHMPLTGPDFKIPRKGFLGKRHIIQYRHGFRLQTFSKQLDHFSNLLF